MDEKELLTLISKSGSNGMTVFLAYLAWQIRLHLSNLNKSIDAIKDDVKDLSTSVTVLIAEQNNGKLEIDRIRDEIKQLWSRVNGKP